MSREKQIYKVTLVGSVGNVALMVFKFVAGIIGHSSAMIADAIHSLSDFLTDLVVLVFVHISAKPQDESHDYGHGKFETIASFLIGLALMAANKKIGKVWYIIKLVGTVAITLTGVVFCFVLAPTMKMAAWSIQNILTHVVVPVASIADFFVIGPCIDAEIKKRSVFFVIIPPLLYAVYAGIGYVKGWQFGLGVNYPYFFLNWGSSAGAFGFSDRLPFMGTGWWIVAIFIFLILVGLLYLAIVKGLRRRVAGKPAG